VEPYGSGDYGGFRNVLPPGENGLVNAPQLAEYEASKTRPPHNDDQLAMYHDLTTAAPNITQGEIPGFFKDATFGVPGGDVESTESPEPGVTIVRDKGFGVPHIYGDTRPALMFGIGWATAEDRLFFLDVLRHAGAGTLGSFAGGSNVSMDEGAWASAPYTQQDLLEQIDYGLSHSPYGAQILSDAQNYVAGINAYIQRAQNPLYTGLLMPAEYVALGRPQGPAPFTLTDLILIGSIIGGELGNGGGDQLNNAILYQALKRRLGPEHFRVAGSPELVGGRGRATRPGKHHDHSGFATFATFDAPNDPEAPATVRGRSFPYQTLPAPTRATLRTIALPDPGSVHFVNHVTAGRVPAAASLAADAGGAPAPGPAAQGHAEAQGGLLAFPHDMSNALLVSAAHSRTGHPIAVMGPQVAYFSPEVLMEQDVHGPGIDADGATFPGTNLYVELGHGRDYAWSATSSGQNIIDTFAVPLCNPRGGSVALDSNYYLLRGRCVQMETLTRSESWQPNFLVDSTPKGSVTFQTQRTAFGLVIARATIHHRPVAYTNLRSTYMHELDSIVGFYLLNNPDLLKNPQDFFNAAYQIDYTFNWFYADDKHIAYFDSGLNPVRAPHTDPLFPTWSTYAWQGYRGTAATTPASLTERRMSEAAMPHVTDQSYLTSWNNKQAPGYGDGATGQEFASVYRSQTLDNNIHHYLAVGTGKMTLTDLINAMGNAGTQDLRGVEVLPYALRIMGHPRDQALAHAVRQLRTWVASGAHRINREHPGPTGDYDQTDAVRVMDAWWPLLVRAEFQPVVGGALLDLLERNFPINDEPGHGTAGDHLGSSWDVGFYGIVQKDLRAALGLHVAGPLNRVYCGNGSLNRCRQALLSSLRTAIAVSPQKVYPADGVCKAGDQMCSDSIQYRAVGAVSQPLEEWINRPTFQQAVEVQGHGPR
jgi:acyl-homoserine lactone acylase PvdQ